MSAHEVNGHRVELEDQANATRERLLATIGALDQKRRGMFDWKGQLGKHALDFATAVSALLIGAGAATAVVAHRYRTRRRRIYDERYHAVVRVWRHPERIAARKSWLGGALRVALVTAAAVATTAFSAYQIARARKAAPRLPPGPPSESYVP